MSSIFHALNTVTLAAWLSVAGFGTVGILVPEWRDGPASKPAPEMVTELQTPEILLDDGNTTDSAMTDPADADPAPADAPEILPTPPEMPDLVEQEPLPEIPDLPTPPQESPAIKSMDSEAAKPTASPRQTTMAHRSTQARGGSSASTAGSVGAGSGLSDSARLAAGRMPAPSYPAAARRAGQTGTVTIAFTVDTSGRVISAYTAPPSPWPLLNEEAVRTVRRWKFPPGGVMKLQRPIIFQLR